jgi:hypothetical protein
VIIGPTRQDNPWQARSPGRIYEHPEAGAMIMLPAVRDSDKVYEHHLAAARLELENFGLADPTVFAAKLQKAG